MIIHDTDNELFCFITGNTYRHREVFKECKGIWIKKGWLLLKSELPDLDFNVSHEIIKLSPDMLLRTFKCDQCESRVPVQALDTHHLFCGTTTVISHSCNNGKILTEDTYKCKNLIKEHE